MKTHFRLHSIQTVLFLVGSMAVVPALRADDFTFNVDLNTAALVSAPNGPFFLDFQLNRGSSTLPSSTATISNFTYTGGTPTGMPTIFSSTTTGNISSGITMVANSSDSVFNEIFQGFTSGTSDIKFSVKLTNTSTGTTPDGFIVSVLDSEDNNPQIPTNSLDGVSLVSVALGGPSFPPNATIANNVTTGQSIGSDAGVTATVTAAVPEPSSWALTGLCIITFATLRRRLMLA